VKLIDGSQQFSGLDRLEDKRFSLASGSNALNVTSLPLSPTDTTGVGNEQPHLVEARTTLETEALWKRRLAMLLDAENNLMKVIRLRKITGIFVVASIAMLLFSLYLAPIMSPVLFSSLIVSVVLGGFIYPVLFVASKSNRKQRDAISRMFYKSNHEIDMADGKITLINRANYACVAQIHVMDRDLGQLATS